MPVNATPGAVSLAWRALPTLVPLLVGAVFLLQIGSLHGPEAIYPAALATVLLAVSGYNLVRELIAHRREVSAAAPDGGDLDPRETERAAPEPERLTIGRPLAVIGLLVLALVLVAPLSFFGTVPVLVLGVLAATGVRRPLALLVSTAAIWACSYLVFGLVLDVPLPRGLWW